MQYIYSMDIWQPAYLELYASGELHHRLEALEAMLWDCRLCAHECHVNRLAGERGFCRAPAEVVVSSAAPHGGEEAPLSGTGGSGTVFFTHCNGRCLFCQNHDISQEGNGSLHSRKQLASTFVRLQGLGCHNINLVTPAHFLPQIVAALIEAVDRGLDLPIVYNSNGYDSVEVLRLLDGIVDIYLPDFKFANARSALALSRLPDYPKRTKLVITEMYRQVGRLQTDARGVARRGLIVRHLVLPGNMAWTDEVLEWLAGLDPDLDISLMGQYYPAHRAVYTEGLDRRLTWDEYDTACRHAQKLGLTRVLTQDLFLFSA